MILAKALVFALVLAAARAQPKESTSGPDSVEPKEGEGHIYENDPDYPIVKKIVNEAVSVLNEGRPEENKIKLNKFEAHKSYKEPGVWSYRIDFHVLHKGSGQWCYLSRFEDSLEKPVEKDELEGCWLSN